MGCRRQPAENRDHRPRSAGEVGRGGLAAGGAYGALDQRVHDTPAARARPPSSPRSPPGGPRRACGARARVSSWLRHAGARPARRASRRLHGLAAADEGDVELPAGDPRGGVVDQHLWSVAAEHRRCAGLAWARAEGPRRRARRRPGSASRRRGRSAPSRRAAAAAHRRRCPRPPRRSACTISATGSEGSSSPSRAQHLPDSDDHGGVRVDLHAGRLTGVSVAGHGSPRCRHGGEPSADRHTKSDGLRQRKGSSGEIGASSKGSHRDQQAKKLPICRRFDLWSQPGSNR